MSYSKDSSGSYTHEPAFEKKGKKPAKKPAKKKPAAKKSAAKKKIVKTGKKTKPT